MPVAVIGGAVGMAKIKRAKKEQAIKTAMSGCPAERGYTGANWTKLSKPANLSDGGGEPVRHIAPAGKSPTRAWTTANPTGI